MDEEIFTIEQFEFHVKMGILNEWDGSGYYIERYEDEPNSYTVSTDYNVWSVNAPDWATHVVWYNK